MNRLTFILAAIFLGFVEVAEADLYDGEAIEANVYLDDGIIAHYPFDGNADDVSGFENHGAVVGATSTEDRFGDPQRAYVFDGINDRIDTPFNFHSFTNQGDPIDFSVSYWMKPEAQDSPRKMFHLQENVSGFPEINNDIRFRDGRDILIFYIRSTNVSRFDGETIVVAPSPGEWHHIVSVFHSDTKLKQIYVDGTLAAEEVSVAPVLTFPDSPLRIGARLSNTEWFKGVLGKN